MHFPDSVLRTPLRPVTIRTWFQIRLENRLQHQLGCGLHHPVPNGRYTERPARRLRALGLSPAALAVVDTSDCATPAGYRSATPSNPVTRYPRSSAHLRPTRPCWLVPVRMHGTACPRDRSCRRACRSGIPARSSPCDTACSEVPESYSVLPDSSSITAPSLLHKHTRSKGPSLHRHCPASSVLWPSPTPRLAAALSGNVWRRDPRQSPSLPHSLQIAFPACRA